MPLALKRNTLKRNKSGEDAVLLERYLSSGDLWVDYDNVTHLDSLVRMSGQDLGYEKFEEILPAHRISRMQTRLFVPDEFFLKEGALALLRSKGFMPATARVLTLVCTRLPELQRHFALLAFGTLVPDREKRETVFCSMVSDFLKEQPPACSWLKQQQGESRRVARRIRTYGGFAPGHAIVGMNY